MGRYALLFFLGFLPFQLNSNGPVLPWVIYYNDTSAAAALQDYNPIVLDSIHHPDIQPLIKKGRVVLGYLNGAEAEERYDWFSSIKNMGILVEENTHWPGSWLVDIRSPFWAPFILNRAIPDILAQGFSGIFIDQIDVAIDLEKRDPIKYRGMGEKAVLLIKAIREKFPHLYIMLNRGYEILDQVGGDIDFVLAETLYTSYNFDSKRYYVRPTHEFEWQLLQLNRARFTFPRLTIFSLDYWDPEDLEMYRKIYSIEREQCMRPYVTPIFFNEIYPEPKK